MNPNISYIPRDITVQLDHYISSGKVVLLYGARQVGKTTLIQHVIGQQNNILYLACDETRIQEQLIPDSLALQKLFEKYSTIVLDEAQYVPEVGRVLKVATDAFPHKRFVATGSSSFELANKVSEPLTGRHVSFTLFPLMVSEISMVVPSTDIAFNVQQALLYGTYPDVVRTVHVEDKTRYLYQLTDSYLYKDILAFQLIKNSKKIRELLVVLALQIGKEVSYHELAGTLGIDKKTIETYIDLLEKSFVIFRLYGFSRNLRSEVNRKVKVYFYDNGVRNILINNLNPLSMRSDDGALFENFVVSELMKKEANEAQKANLYFWRTYTQKEVDIISEKNGQLTATEVKLTRPKHMRGISAFKNEYPEALSQTITLQSFLDNV